MKKSGGEGVFTQNTASGVDEINKAMRNVSKHVAILALGTEAVKFYEGPISATGGDIIVCGKFGPV